MPDEFSLYDAGDSVRFTKNFKDVSNADADPTTVIFRVKHPDKTVETWTFPTDSEIVKDSVGNYHIDYVIPDKSGEYAYEWEGTGAIVSISTWFFEVKRIEFT